MQVASFAGASLVAKNNGEEREEEESGKEQRGMGKKVKTPALCPIYSAHKMITAVHYVT